MSVCPGPGCKQARQLIDDKQYDEARAILKSIDDPRAREWLKRIDKLDPKKGQGSGGVFRAVLGYLLVIIISAVMTTVALLAALVMATASSRGAARIQAVEDAQATVVAEAATATPTPDLRTGIVTSTQNINVRSEPRHRQYARLLPWCRGPRSLSWVKMMTAPGTTCSLSRWRTGWVAAQLLNAEPAPTAVAAAGGQKPPAPDVPRPRQIANKL